MILQRVRSWCLAIVAIGAVGCSDSTGGLFSSCNNPTVGFNLAMLVSVRDSVTGSRLDASASGMLQSATYSDSLRHNFFTDTLLTGLGGPGTYLVTVDRPGYGGWTRAGVVVAADQCGRPVTVQLTALLQGPP